MGPVQVALERQQAAERAALDARQIPTERIALAMGREQIARQDAEQQRNALATRRSVAADSNTLLHPEVHDTWLANSNALREVQRRQVEEMRARTDLSGRERRRRVVELQERQQRQMDTLPMAMATGRVPAG